MEPSLPDRQVEPGRACGSGITDRAVVGPDQSPAAAPRLRLPRPIGNIARPLNGSGPRQVSWVPGRSGVRRGAALWTVRGGSGPWVRSDLRPCAPTRARGRRPTPTATVPQNRVRLASRCKRLRPQSSPRNLRPRLSSPAPAQSARSLLMAQPQIRGKQTASLHDHRNFRQTSAAGGNGVLTIRH